MKPICVSGRKFFRMKKSGVYFEEEMPLRDESEWGPYKIWAGDVWQCDSCGTEIISGVGLRPLAEHYQPDYAEHAARLSPMLRVDDC